MVAYSPLACTFEEDVTPPSLATKDATGVTTNQATLNGHLTGLGSASGVDVSFQWGTESGSYTDETTMRTMTAAGAAGAFSFDLTGLNADTSYYYRAKAVGDGTSFGLEKSFTTSTIPPSVGTSDATSISTNSAQLNGELASLGTADNVTVSFEWGLDTSYGNETTGKSMTSTGSWSAELTGLKGFTVYHFRTKAVGQGTALGADAQFTTGSIPPSVATVGYWTNPFINTTVGLAGELLSLGTADNVTVSFEWGLDTSYGNETEPHVMTSTGGWGGRMWPLKGFTEYHFRAKAVGHGTSYGADLSFATGPPMVPWKSDSPCRIMDMQNSTSTSARLNGYLLGLETFDSVPAMFYWRTAAGGPYPNGTLPWQDMTSSGAFYFDLGGLSPGTTYYYISNARDAFEIVHGAEMSFTTTSGP
jgi:hypothetical protein